MPNPTLLTGTQNNAAISSGTSATVTSTGSVTAGNFMIVFMLVGGATQPTAFTAPDGTWTASLATTATASGGLIAAGIFTKRATASGAFSGAFGWTTTATSGHWAFTEWSGTTGLDGAISSTQNASATNTSPSVTPATGLVNDTLVCCCFAGVVGVDTLTVPAGMAAISSMATAGTSAIPFFNGASLNLASASATGTKTWTIPTSRTNLGVSFLLQQGPIWGFSGGADFGDTVNPPFQTAKVKHFAAIAPKYDGTEGAYRFWINDGWAREDKWQPPHPKRERFASLAPKEDANEGVYQFWYNAGWAVQPPQPPHPRPEKFASVVPKEDGTEFKFAFTPPVLGWGQESGWQPPHPRPEKFGSIAPKDDGTEGKFNFWYNDGWEVQPWQPPHFNTEKRAPGLKGKSEFAFFTSWQFMGWEIQPPQPPHPKPERFASIAPKEDGTEFPFSRWFNDGWEIQPPQPPHPRPEQRWAATYINEDGIEFPFVPPVLITSGWDTQNFQRIPFRYSPAIMRGDDGTEGIYQFWHNAGWEVQPVQPNHPVPEKRFAAIAPKEDGTEGQFNFWINDGWEPQIWLPPHPRPEKFAAIAPKEDGTEMPFSTVIPLSPWSYDLHPLFPKKNYARAGAIETFPFIEYPFVNWVNNGWEQESGWQPPHFNTEKRAPGLKGRSEFAFFTPWQFMGWEVRPVQPNHPRPEKFAAIAPKEDGIEFPFVFTPTTPFFGYDVQQTVSRVRYERAGSIQTFPFIEYPFVNWINEGWEAVLHQPRHPRPERIGAMLQGIDGVATFIVFYPSGWEVQPMQPGHPRPERFGAIVPKEDGIEFPFIFTPVVTTGFFMANPIMGPALIGRGGYIPNPKNP